MNQGFEDQRLEIASFRKIQDSRFKELIASACARSRRLHSADSLLQSCESTF
jgi:hypothetical protein